MFFLDELVDLVQEPWRQTPFNTTDMTWSWISSLEGHNTLTNTAAWPPTVLGDGTRRLARRHVAFQSLQVQRRPRAATTPFFDDQEGICRARDWTRCVRTCGDLLFLWVIVLVRAHGWCNFVFLGVRLLMRKCPLSSKCPTRWATSD